MLFLFSCNENRSKLLSSFTFFSILMAPGQNVRIELMLRMMTLVVQTYKHLYCRFLAWLVLSSNPSFFVSARVKLNIQTDRFKIILRDFALIDH